MDMSQHPGTGNIPPPRLIDTEDDTEIAEPGG